MGLRRLGLAACIAIGLAAISSPGNAAPPASTSAAARAADPAGKDQGREAEARLRAALKTQRKALGEQHPDTGAAYAALGDVLAARGKAREAERLHRRALAILRATKGEHDPATAAAYAGVARDLAARGRYAEADPLLKRVLEIRRVALGESDPDTARAYDALAENQHRLAAIAPAEALSSKAVAIVRARRAADGAAADPDALRRRARTDAEAALADEAVFRRYLTVAWLAAQETPADLPRLRDAAFSAAQDLAVSPAARAIAHAAARAAPARGPAARPQAPARAPAATAAVPAGGELASLDARLSRSDRRYAEMVAPPALTLGQAQRRLRAGEGLLLIVPTETDIHVFAVSRGRVAWHRLEGGRADVERRIRGLRCQLDDLACSLRGPAVSRDGHALFDGKTAHGLYGDLVAPVEPALAGVDRLYVTSSGAIAGLPLGLLPTGAPGALAPGPQSLAAMSWLADRYALTTLPSVASLHIGPRMPRAAQRWAFVGYGAPALPEAKPAERRQAGAGAPAFGPLPGTSNELRAMARALGASQASLHLRDQATEAALKASPELARAGVVAIATHGLLSHEIDGVGEPGLVLTPPAKATAEDDGVLTASEAAALELSADWVILSACNTAGPDGAPGADSLSGLARAFLYAGARALLVSHWRVYDDATAALTVQTLAIQRGSPRLTKAQALQRAMRVVRTGRQPDGKPLPGWRTEWAHPAYWAPFVLIASEG